MVTGPFVPGAPVWMWAACPSRPVVLTLPLSILSSPALILPEPDAEVVTGGTSWFPLSVTLSPLKKDTVESHPDFIVSQPARASADAAITAGIDARQIIDDFIIRS